MAEEKPSVGDLHGIGQWAKPFSELQAIISRRWIEPTTIRQLAQANADARQIEQIAETKIEIEKAELRHRAFMRMSNEAVAIQVNIENVLKKTAPQIADTAKPQDIDPDWTQKFLDHAGKTSNEEMQQLWAQILAGEANVPGTFSKRTLNLVAEISKTEAELFTLLCCLSLDNFGPIVFAFDDSFYLEKGLTFGAFQNLQNAGLITTVDVVAYIRTALPVNIGTAYFGRVIVLPKTGGTLTTGKVALTPAGNELRKITTITPIEGFFDYLLKGWSSAGAKELLNFSSAGYPTMQRTINENGEVTLGSFVADS